MELTKEQFEQVLDQKLSKMATKADLEHQTKELKAFAEDQTEHLARLVSNSVIEPISEQFKEVKKDIKNLDIKPRLEKLEKDMAGIKTALSLS